VIPNGIGDGAGGGGGGGTILLDVGTFSSGVCITANGGHGGDQNTTYGACFGPGGGGGAGVIWFSQNSTPSNAFPYTLPGTAGMDLNPSSGCYLQSYGALPGANGNGVLYNLALPEGHTVGPIVNLGNDSTYCSGTLLLDAQNPGSTYLWNTGATSQTMNVTSGGTYAVMVTDSQGCTARDTINFTSTIINFDLGPDTTICGSKFVLVANVSADTYQWSTGATGNSTNITSSGTYSVTVTSGNCTSSDAITIDMIHSSGSSIDFPNVFTPNDDQNNDLFTPLLPPGVDVDLKVYDRWGLLLYESHDTNPAWDGRDTKGSKAAEGTYYWIAHYQTGCPELRDETKTGFVSLFRK
jgi:gliding motility-associated-like protein